jgi:hypothetical protein
MVVVLSLLSIGPIMLSGLLQDRKEAGFQGAAALWRSARCPRSSSSFSPPQAAKRKNATAVVRDVEMRNVDKSLNRCYAWGNKQDEERDKYLLRGCRELWVGATQ